jgi:hypothetical protein
MGRPSNEHDAAAEELAAFGEFGGEVPGMQRRRVLIGTVVPDPVGRNAVFVKDVKEEVHALD